MSKCQLSKPIVLRTCAIRLAKAWKEEMLVFRNIADLARAIILPSACAALSAATTLAQVPPSSLTGSSTSRSTWDVHALRPIAPQYGTVKRLGIPVRMSDGVELTVDVSYPADLATGQIAMGRFPVLLTQTPYLTFDPAAGDYFVARGYIYVTAYVRGTSKSGGDFGFFSDRDAKDGAELVNWVARQLPGSSGVVGLHGGSYMGITQMFTLAALGSNSPVRALEANCMGAEFYREAYFAGGIPTQTLNFQRVIQGAMGRSTGPSGAAIVSNVEAGGDLAYDGDFWKSRTVGELVPRIVATGVPIMLWSSDGDIYAQSSYELYAYLQNAAAGRPVYGPMAPNMVPSGKYQIFMSQGGHCANMDERVQLDWFDTWLKGKPTGMDQVARPMHIMEGGTNAWIDEPRYPATQAYSKYFLKKGGLLETRTSRQSGHQTITWAQPGPGSRLTFDGPVYREGARLAGPVGASVVASSTTRNLMLIASLEVVGSDGSVRPLSSGAVLGSLSENNPTRSWTAPNGGPMRPYGTYVADKYPAIGVPRRYDFAISPRFTHLPTGSRIRLVITTQTPAEDCKPTLGTAPCFPTAPQIASLTGAQFNVYFGGNQGSYLNLPIIQPHIKANKR